MDAEKSFRNVNHFQVVIMQFRLIQHQTKFRLVLSVITILGILPLGKYPPQRSTPVYSSKECSSRCCSGQQLASLALGLRTLVSKNRFASTAYFAQSQTVLFHFHAYFSWGECSGGETTGLEPSGGNFPGGKIPVTVITN